MGVTFLCPMTNDTPVCALCLESDANESLIVLHEKFEHYLHKGCYSKKTMGLTCPLCKKPFSSQQSRELLDNDQRDSLDLQLALKKNLKDGDFFAVEDCIFDESTPNHVIFDAFSLKSEVVLPIDLERFSKLVVFLICAVASEDMTLISLALKWASRYKHNMHPANYRDIAIETCLKLRLFKVLKYLAAYGIKPKKSKSIELIKMFCKDNDLEAAKNYLNAFPDLSQRRISQIFFEPTSEEMADVLLTAWSQTIFYSNRLWKLLDFECFISRYNSNVQPIVVAWEKMRAAGFKGKFLPPPNNIGEYRKRIRLD